MVTHQLVSRFIDKSAGSTEDSLSALLVPQPALPETQGWDASISAISCASSSLCAGAGTTTTQQATFLVLYSMMNGTWSASLVALPAGAAPYSPTVDCAPDSSVCVADDSYVVSGAGNSTVEAIVSTFSDSSWTSLPVLPLLPGNAASDPNVFLSQPSCAVAAFCVILGSYENNETPQAQVSFTLSEISPGNWAASVIPMALYAVSCPAAGWCAATGGSGDIYVLSGNLEIWLPRYQPASLGVGPRETASWCRAATPEGLNPTATELGGHYPTWQMPTSPPCRAMTSATAWRRG